MSSAVAIFRAAAEEEWAFLNADGFWENFSIGFSAWSEDVRVSAHRVADISDQGWFESIARMDSSSPVMVAAGAVNLVQSLDYFRTADWVMLQKVEGSGA